MDATRILPRLYLGSAPSPPELCRGNFDAVVLCARDYQPSIECARVVRCPLDDDYTRMLGRREWNRVSSVAVDICSELAAGRKVLVTCVAGLNRSALVCGVALYLHTGRPGAALVAELRRRRPGSLANPRFVEALLQLR